MLDIISIKMNSEDDGGVSFSLWYLDFNQIILAQLSILLLLSIFLTVLQELIIMVSVTVVCDQCNASFNSKTAYNYHKRFQHLGEKAVCGECGKQSTIYK